MARLSLSLCIIGFLLLSLQQVVHAYPYKDPAYDYPDTHTSPKMPRNQITISKVGSPVDMTSGVNGTYPRANMLADGTLLGTYTTFPNNGTYSQINVAKSTDGGTTWNHLANVTNGPVNTTDIDNPYILELPSKRLLLAIRNHSKNGTNGTYTYIQYRITIFHSEDGGSTWSWLSQPVTDPVGPTGDWEPFLRNTLDGSLQLYYSHENSGADQDTRMLSSRDAGVTWSSSATVSGAETNNTRDGMTGVVDTGGGNLIAVFESSYKGLFTVNYVRSPDDGRTWSNRTRLYTPRDYNNSAGAPQIIKVGEVLVCSFMTDEDSGLHHWFDGANAKIVISTDKGVTWSVSQPALIFPAQTNWPSMVALDQSSFLVMADHYGAHSQKVMLVGSLNSISSRNEEEEAQTLEVT